MNDPKLKQQIADKIKDSSNILVTVSNDPSVDELSAALGLTLLLNKIDKHATAVFSGKIPPAITFLDPEKTFEGTTDSLRDFIIALDKEKADHLRYKLEGDLVKIYITPYRTTIASDDLEFSQGDYNVELVIALGVENKDHLDAALSGHGKILHDATVVTLTSGEQVSNLGSIDWHDSNASSLSEMLVSLSESMNLEKNTLDQSIATAWLTGIVASTERFSNTRTTSRVMTLAANLMAAGADQQLIASKLQEAVEEEQADTEVLTPSVVDEDGSLPEGQSKKIDKTQAEPEPKKKSNANGELAISHEKKGTIEEIAAEVNAEKLEASARAAERALEKQAEDDLSTAPVAEVATPVESVPRGPVSYTPPTQASISPAVAPESIQNEPTFGGTLNATSEQAEEDKRRDLESDKNKIILSHNYIGNQQPSYDAPINGAVAEQTSDSSAGLFGSGTPSSAPEIEPPSALTAVAAPLSPLGDVNSGPPPVSSSFENNQPVTASLPQVNPAGGISAPTLADIDLQNRAPHDEARAAVEAALAGATPVAPPLPADLGLPLPPPLPTDFSNALPPLPPSGAPEILGDILASEQPGQVAPTPQADTAATPVSNDPGQFRIPGQS